MSADEKELLLEAQIKARDFTLDDATRYRYQAIEKYIMEKNTVLKKKEKERREKEIALAKLGIPA